MANNQLKIKACTLAVVLSTAALGTLYVYRTKTNMFGVCIVAFFTMYCINYANDLSFAYDVNNHVVEGICGKE